MEVLQRTANRGSIATGAAYEIENSCKFEPDNSESMTRTATASQGGNRKTWTWSGWIKRTELGSHMYLFSAGGTGLQILSSDNIRFSLYYNNTSYYLDLNAKLRDTSAWYHIVGQLDTTQSTAQDRVKVWINGERQTSFSNDSAHNIPQNADVQHLNEATGTSTGWMKICDWYASGRFFSGYTADWHFTDGVANEPTEFGEYDSDSGIWIPKAYGGSYGTNGFYLDFADADDLGDDESGNGNDFSEGNLTSIDQALDTPTNNFCTLNPLDNNWANVPTINEGATTHMLTSPSVWRGSSGTIAVSNGKWYWEIKTTHSGGNVYMLGIGSTQYGEVPGSQSPHDVLNFAGLYLANSATEGGLFVTDSTGGSVYRNAFNPGANHSANDIYGFALDLDSSPQTITFYRNGTNINPSSGAPLDIAGACSILPVTIRLSIFEREAQCNFGGYTEFSISSGNSDANGYGTFEYAPPSGYYALCTKNLAEYG